jgi:1-acyl-sn-glycerol-3-phosphate acyltransferase
VGQEHWGQGIEIEHPGRASPTVVSLARRFLYPFVWVCHRPLFEGIENLPTRGPFLLVANHSAGTGLAEILSFVALWARAFDGKRPIAGFALPIGFRVFPLSRLLRAAGAIPSTYSAAKQAIALGSPILVFPGGDHEALRPLWQANRVDFGGRVGFLRIARASNIPIVPLGIAGGHFTGPILVRSRVLATLLVVPRLIGVKRWGLSVLGVMVAVAIATQGPGSWAVRAILIWLWLGSPFVFSPWVPWKIRMRVGEPIAASELFAERGAREGEDEAELRRALTRVEGAVQSLVTAGVVRRG